MSAGQHPLPPFLEAQRDYREGKPFENPYPPPDYQTIDHAHDLYRRGWLVQQWRDEHDKMLKAKKK